MAKLTSSGRHWARGLLVLALVTAVFTPVAVIAAGGTFTDDDDSIFEANIEWLAAADVTRGCNPPTNDNFCPNDNVTRGQMAAFMHRFAQFLGAEDGQVSSADTADTATTADSAMEADNADTVDGYDAGAFVRYESTVPAFTTLTGAFAMSGYAAGVSEVATTEISFVVPMPTDLMGHIINVGDPLPAGCSGDPSAPAADPGHLCIFVGYSSESGMITGFYRADNGFNDGTVSPYGVAVYLFSDGAGYYEATGTWAATAPLQLIVLPSPGTDAIQGSIK